MKKSICIRLLLIVIFLFCGKVFPVFFFVAALIAYSIFFDLRGEPHKGTDSPVPNAWALQHQKDLTFITPKTIGWKEVFEGVCESPAEVGFLNAMISSYQLIPDQGTLKGESLELQLQIPIYRYRVDFLANKHLVVEIDGAAYHSSPEAVEKDRIRDEYFIENGYVVLRIPAKVVFNSPGDAVERVRRALSNLAHELSIRAQEADRVKALKKTDSPRTFFSELGQALAHGSDWMADVLVLQKTEVAFNETFNHEKAVIEKTIELAKMRIETESWLARLDPRTRQLHLDSRKELNQIMASVRKNPPSSPSPILPLRPPDLGSDPKYSTAIKEMYSGLLEKRCQYFNDIRKTLEKDSELAKHVKETLGELCENSDDIWQSIRVNLPGERPTLIRVHTADDSRFVPTKQSVQEWGEALEVQEWYKAIEAKREEASRTQ